MDKERIEHAVREILEAIGEDPQREGLVDTPKRVARMSRKYFADFKKSEKHLMVQFFDEKHEEMVLVKDILYSMCEHFNALLR